MGQVWDHHLSSCFIRRFLKDKDKHREKDKYKDRDRETDKKEDRNKEKGETGPAVILSYHKGFGRI